MIQKDQGNSSDISANQPLQDYKQLSFDVLNTYRMKYGELEWILGDEISMVSNDMEISTPTSTRDKTKKRSIWRCQYYHYWEYVSTHPVKGNYVFMDLRCNYGPLSINRWHEYFTMYELEEIMCQKK